MFSARQPPFAWSVSALDKLKKHGVLRKLVQAASGLAANAHLSGFLSGKIYAGPLKRFCVPGLNCYSCPGAVLACPIGSLQSFLGAKHPKFAFYVLGYMSLAGVLVGRFICGWLCLFGLIQELLFLIPVPKLCVPPRLDRHLRRLKYVMLAALVVLLPIILRDEMGLSAPYFCKWICPAGTLEGGIPLLLLNRGMRSAAHFLYAWKLAILAIILLLSAVIHRPFCKYLCPLGAFYGLFHRFSFLRLRFDPDVCVHCGRCAGICDMQVDPTEEPDSPECIRCGACAKICPAGALHMDFKAGRVMKGEKA